MFKLDATLFQHRRTDAYRVVGMAESQMDLKRDGYSLEKKRQMRREEKERRGEGGKDEDRHDNDGYEKSRFHLTERASKKRAASTPKRCNSMLKCSVGSLQETRHGKEQIIPGTCPRISPRGIPFCSTTPISKPVRENVLVGGRWQWLELGRVWWGRSGFDP